MDFWTAEPRRLTPFNFGLRKLAYTENMKRKYGPSYQTPAERWAGFKKSKDKTEVDQNDNFKRLSLTEFGEATMNSADNGTHKPPAPIQRVPDEILLNIFNYLRDKDSVCIGLTCKQMYNIHKDVYGLKVPLSLKPPTLETDHVVLTEEELQLYVLLENWMGPQYVWGGKNGRHAKFFARDEFDEWCKNRAKKGPKRLGCMTTE